MNALTALLVGLLLLACSAAPAVATRRERILFDDGWRFALGHASDPARDFGFADSSWGEFSKTGFGSGPISANFPASSWRLLDLPHDWAIELPFDPKADTAHGSKPIGRHYPQNSVGWYRKTFTSPASDEGRRAKLVFDGVYRDAQVWLNGSYLARNESGYIGFEADLTDYLRWGKSNTVVVRVNASDFEGWFYEGAGIYRHVWMVKTGAAHLEENDLFVQAEPKGATASLLCNGSAVDAPEGSRIAVEVLDAQGKIVARDLANRTFTLSKPRLWSLEDPYLYRARVTLVSPAGEELDQIETTFGIRRFHFDPDRGFFLNGKPVKIKGTCNHQDHAGVGVAVPDRLNEFRIERLKEMGCNAYRTSHNAPTPELLDACDRLGMLVMDETRQFGSGPLQMSELERLVRRDRNHPSVILWSLGNEEGGIQLTSEGERAATRMKALVRRLDPTRPITYGGNHGAEREGIEKVVDLRGFNYSLPALEPYHRENPDHPVHFSEVASTLCTRGEYANDATRGYMSSYDLNNPGWGETAEEWWSFTAERPWVAGGFVWTGFDYRGEPTPYGWPCISSHFGSLDTCGYPKDNYYYYQAWWTDQTVLHILPHWNWPGREGQQIDIWVHSNLEEVELIVNGVSQGRKRVQPNRHLEWRVAYQPGKVEAHGYRKGKLVRSETVATTGKPARLVIEPDRDTIRADGRDVSIFKVSAVDAEGRVVPLANNKVAFEVVGAGHMLGVGNGDPSCHEPDVFFSTPVVREIGEWKHKAVDGDLDNRPETAPDFDDSGWPSVSIERNQDMPPNSLAVLRAEFEIGPKDAFRRLEVGAIDDVGRVFVNGQLVGKTDQWDASWEFDVQKHLRPGRNVIAIVVRNNGGQGGLSKGVRLAGDPIPAAWSRSLFHGLAQAIVQSNRQPGTLTIRASSPGLTPAEVTISVR